MRANYSPSRKTIVGSNSMVVSLQQCVPAKSKLPVRKKVLEKLPVRWRIGGICMVMERLPGNGRIPAYLRAKNEWQIL